MTLQVAVEAVSFWATRLPGWDIASGVMRGERTAAETNSPRPAPMLLAPTERRRAPDTVAVALEVAARVCEAAGRAPSDLPSVFASTHGDLAIIDYTCSTLASTPTLISPIKFHNSVHNAAAGYWSIGTGSLAPYTAISAYEYTFGVGLLETATQALCENRPVLYVAYDIEAKGPMAAMAPSRGLLGVGLIVAPSALGRGRNLILSTESTAAKPTPARSSAAALVAGNALAPCLPFLEAMALPDPRTLQLALGRQAALNVQVSQ